VSTGVALRQRL